MALCRDCRSIIPCHCHLTPPKEIRPGVYEATDHYRLRDNDAIECVHDCPEEPNKGAQITLPPTVQDWLPGAPRLPGRIWCWSHCRWEDNPATETEGA